MQWYRYNSEPVVVSLQRDYRSWWSHFPAITACLIDRVNRDKAKEAIEMYFNMTEELDPEKYAYYSGLVELIADVAFRSNLQNFWKYQTDDSVKGIDLQQLAQSVHPNLQLSATVSDYIKEVIWIPVMTEVGMCLTFNSKYARFQFLRGDEEWQDEPLYKCHYHSGQCYVRIDSVNQPIRYFIHSPFEISTSISNPTGEVTPGEELILDFKAIEIQSSPSVRSLRPDQRRCRYPDEWISNNIQMAYHATRTACLASGATSKFSSIYPRISPSAPAFLSVPSSTSIHIQKRSLIASLGGTTALFVGASVLTVVETFLFIIRRCVEGVLPRRPRGPVRPIQFRP